MSKNIGFRVPEGVNKRFEDFHAQSEKQTKGESFALLLELAEQTPANTEALTNELTRVNAELTEKNTMLADVSTKLTECKQALTEQKHTADEYESLFAEKTKQINMLTDENRLLTEAKQTTITVPPEWEAKAKKVAEINGLSHPYEVLWHLFAKFLKYDFHYGLKHLKDSEIKEIEQQFKNNPDVSKDTTEEIDT